MNPAAEVRAAVLAAGSLDQPPDARALMIVAQRLVRPVPRLDSVRGIAVLEAAQTLALVRPPIGGVHGSEEAAVAEEDVRRRVGRPGRGQAQDGQARPEVQAQGRRRKKYFTLIMLKLFFITFIKTPSKPDLFRSWRITITVHSMNIGKITKQSVI